MLNKNFFNLPNQLTILRVILIPAFLIFLYFDTYVTNVIAAVIFAVASLTDFVDGYLARKYNIVTDIGKILDPVADKILVASSLIALMELGRVEGVVVILLLSRDFAVGALRDLSASKGKIIAAGFSGKLKTVFQMIAVGFLIYKNNLIGIDIFFIGKILIYLSVVLSIYSGVEYYIKFFAKINE
ncbi:CDP-diacylglycerol--glycerol-3-phosphate 3-phosphatidyltransferase [Deferribacterales bacterium Es71-Z0220]|uniref:CDP-diacylglycerol--glycerol-3-phosphate 3-phosphatidyltransferase n=1 Tax=Deferrivibrio essentukiensis TaxID=2880922 RepID=UPI001F609585|nr:CDP-diacylglycerol--glycerol-3-phosphate 3-phosphatidyltransferase [Deferrivibrio essentukiensis]MCB4204196.1 CDP-diacylglycerol--glycerol-3-phosphate 3-phosphatidyltransferase [Deferrivibrio essentukiensis]